MTRRGLVVLLLLLVLPACGGLPLPSGVRGAGEVPVEQVGTGDIVVVAPGPQEGDTATELVRGYLLALSVSPENDYAIAQQYLAPGVRCCDGGEAILYPPGSPDIELAGGDEDLVRVRFDSVGRILRDGSYRPEDTTVVDDFRVTRIDGRLRLSQVPNGLRLLEADLERSFRAYDVHFLGRGPEGEPSPRLVPDRVFLPATADPAQALVNALLQGPSARLSSAVQTAVPPGATARARTDGSVVTVDLSREVRLLSRRARQRLAAQLVWSLVPVFTGVRLLVDGQSLDVGRAGGVQDRDDWDEYDPAAVRGNAQLLFVRNRRLARLDDRGVTPVAPQSPAVDEAASSPSNDQIAVRTRVPGGLDEIRLGQLDGPFGDPALIAPGLTSLSWGAGDQGLWLVERGRPAKVWLLPATDLTGREPVRVSYRPPPGAGSLSRLRMSRDGARAAMVFDGRLHVGLVVPGEDGPRVDRIELVSRELVDVRDVAWQSGTSLVALGSFELGEQPFPAEVAVDGSSFAVVQRSGAAGAVEVAAAPRRPLVVSADVDGRRELFRDNGELFRQLKQPGSNPFYPG